MTTIVLGALLLAVIAAWLYRERENAKERAALCDRIQAPGAASVAAMESVWPMDATPAPDLYTEEVPPGRHHDLALQALLGDE